MSFVSPETISRCLSVYKPLRPPSNPSETTTDLRLHTFSDATHAQFHSPTPLHLLRSGDLTGSPPSRGLPPFSPIDLHPPSSLPASQTPSPPSSSIPANPKPTPDDLSVPLSDEHSPPIGLNPTAPIRPRPTPVRKPNPRSYAVLATVSIPTTN